ncbi:beta-ketoacyl synthase N-terminal-like domain-containing protein [Actinomyces wuliandei]|uniref:beta-ketoacyl synthase N-terminal-like domain-containing protein n=1 Tax=Actinomyces wuliandei TaxID=2057743 RepID=UPI001119E25E|nr:beta-ketoacyl synthase N-terminal-like domain-containing protein [Actinomyces wuliandei]
MGAPEMQISECAVLTAAGNSMDTLTEAIDRPLGSRAPSELGALPDPEVYEGVPGRVAAVPDFRIEDYVPRRGTRSLDRMTRLGIAASVLLRRQMEERRDIAADSWRETGISLGTSAGSLRSNVDLTLDVIRGRGADLINPKVFPNSTMNCCASQVAIWNDFHGPNATVANGTVSALSALRYASRLMSLGHCSRMLVGSVEELSPQRAWGTRLSGRIDSEVVIGESATLFSLEPAGASPSPVATVTGCEVAFCPISADGARSETLRRVVDRVCSQPEDVDLVVPGATGTVWQLSEERSLEHVTSRRLDVRRSVGDCGAGTSGVQVAAALTCAGPGDRVLLTSMDESGVVAAAMLQMCRS